MKKIILMVALTIGAMAVETCITTCDADGRNCIRTCIGS